MLLDMIQKIKIFSFNNFLVIIFNFLFLINDIST
jgi:hypothetical protein